MSRGRQALRFTVQVGLVLCSLRALMAAAVVSGASSFPNAAPRLMAAPLQHLLINGVLAVVLALVLWRLRRAANVEAERP